MDTQPLSDDRMTLRQFVSVVGGTTLMVVLTILAVATILVAATVEEDGSGRVAGETVEYCLPWRGCAR